MINMAAALLLGITILFMSGPRCWKARTLRLVELARQVCNPSRSIQGGAESQRGWPVAVFVACDFEKKFVTSRFPTFIKGHLDDSLGRKAVQKLVFYVGGVVKMYRSE